VGARGGKGKHRAVTFARSTSFIKSSLKKRRGYLLYHGEKLAMRKMIHGPRGGRNLSKTHREKKAFGRTSAKNDRPRRGILNKGPCENKLHPDRKNSWVRQNKILARGGESTESMAPVADEKRRIGGPRLRLSKNKKLGGEQKP